MEALPTTQGDASSSGDAKLYAMVEGVTRAKGLETLASELGFTSFPTVVKLFTDSEAAKQFVCRRGLGRMKHLQIKDLWLSLRIPSM